MNQLAFVAFNQIVSRNGIRGLYRGFSTCLVGIAPEKAIKLAVNDVIREFFAAKNPVASSNIKVHQEIIAGSIAGLLQLVVTVPYEMVKIRLQLQGNIPELQRKSAFTIVNELGSTGGVYRGFTATMYRDVPFCIIFFPLYSNIKTLLTPSSTLTVNGVLQEPFHIGLLSGMFSGAVAGKKFRFFLRKQ